MELSIIITNYKQPELLKVCINSIKKNLTLSDYEIIVSDSEAEEKTGMMMREDFPDVAYIPFEKNVGFSVALNAGYKKSKGRFLLFLNADMIINENSIENLLDYAKNHPEAGIVGPKLLSFNNSPQLSCSRFYTPLTIIYRRTFLGKFNFAKKHLDWFMMKDYDRKTIREVDWVQGSAMMTRREAVEKVGLMDQNFTMYFEDVDWCRRFWEAGYKIIYFPASQIYHYHGRGSAGRNVIATLLSKRLAWLHIASALKYFWKYRGKPLPKHN